MIGQLWPRGGGSGTELADSIKGIWTPGVNVTRNDVWTKNGFSWVALVDVPNSVDAPNDEAKLPLETYNGVEIAPKIVPLTWEGSFPNNEYRVFAIDVETPGDIRFAGNAGNRQQYVQEMDPTIGNHNQIRHNAGGMGFAPNFTWPLTTGRHLFLLSDPYGTKGLTIVATAENGLVVTPPSVKWAKLGTLIEPVDA